MTPTLWCAASQPARFKKSCRIRKGSAPAKSKVNHDRTAQPGNGANGGGRAPFASSSIVGRRPRSLFTLGGSTLRPNSTPYEENTKRPVLVGRIRLVPDGLVHRLPKHADANRSRTKKSPRLLARRRA